MNKDTEGSGPPSDSPRLVILQVKLSQDPTVQNNPLSQPDPSVPAMTTETIAINLIRMFSEGPLVSLNGSPMVSPTIAAL